MINRTIVRSPTTAVAGRTRGFTLLELLVVIVIISILFTYATLTIRGSSPEDIIKEEATRLNRLVQLALEEAILRNTEYGIEFNPHGYRFLYYKEEKWHPMDDDKLLRERELPRDMEIELSIEQIDVIIAADNDIEDEKKLEPQVFLLSSEEISPEFSALFTIPGIETSYVVHGSIDGQHSVKPSEL